MQTEKNEVIYNGKIVEKEHFRVFLYGKDDTKKLANNWADYERLKATGEWFDTLEAVEYANPKSKKKEIQRKFKPATGEVSKAQQEAESGQGIEYF